MGRGWPSTLSDAMLVDGSTSASLSTPLMSLPSLVRLFLARSSTLSAAFLVRASASSTPASGLSALSARTSVCAARPSRSAVHRWTSPLRSLPPFAKLHSRSDSNVTLGRSARASTARHSGAILRPSNTSSSFGRAHTSAASPLTTSWDTFIPLGSSTTSVDCTSASADAAPIPVASARSFCGQPARISASATPSWMASPSGPFSL
mmetsp:Transcript_44058/g.129810  ORF Transcript_44058/g.129810 Transcript_44058/m.129810 type:complete len:206 (-) Transcript_44058:376-993(-)